MAELTFEPDGHIYRCDGRVVPGVTAVLEPLQYLEGVPWAVLEAAREFGTHVHIACDLWTRHMLDLESLDPALLPYLQGWIAFLAESGFVVTASEQRVHNRKLGYAGTADAFGTWKGTSWVLDIKSGVVPPTVGMQLSAYQMAADPIPRRRLCVQLTGDGHYKLHEQKNLADFNLFKSALNIFQFRQRRKPADVHDYA
jgi:hypothetical protein